VEGATGARALDESTAARARRADEKRYAHGPRCGVSVGAVEACMRRWPGDVCEPKKPAGPREPVRSCLPAVRDRPAVKP
jgi:hypothetical protein